MTFKTAQRIKAEKEEDIGALVAGLVRSLRTIPEIRKGWEDIDDLRPILVQVIKRNWSAVGTLLADQTSHENPSPTVEEEVETYRENLPKGLSHEQKEKAVDLERSILEGHMPRLFNYQGP